MENNQNKKSPFSDPENLDIKYQQAQKRVQKIKGFYIHLLVYVLVNGFTITSAVYKNIMNGQDLFLLHKYNQFLFWGIGLIIHGISVFGENLFLGSAWKEKKIRELMEKEKNTKWE